MSDTPSSIPSDAVAALERGNKVEAIKITRKATGAGLKEAKDTVEKYLAENPSTYERFKEQNQKPGIGRLVLVVLLLAFIFYRFFAGKF